jgi:hypothetical protein
MMISTVRVRRARGGLALWGTLLGIFAAGGCAVDEKDLARWEGTLEGPKRLSAVITHDKYPYSLRVEAAVSLIRMKPRKGQHVGLKRLVEETLVEMPPAQRDKIVEDLIPRIIAELRKPPPAPAQGGKSVADPSFTYKDAAYMMLTFDKTQIITNQAKKKELMGALTEWAMADFERRLNDRNQTYGMEQLLRQIGPSSVVGLPKLMTKESRNLSKIADLVARLGDKETKELASRQLVDVMKHVVSEPWRKEHEEQLKQANLKAQLEPTEEQFKRQLAEFQDEEVTRVFASMKAVGGKAVVEYCLGIAADKGQDKKRRQASLAALEGHIDRDDAKQIDALFAIAKTADLPPEVTDQVFRRIKELPRDKAAERLYDFFKSTDWKLRRLAGATVLAMSTAKHIDEFLGKLGDFATKNFNLAEALTLGALLGELKEGDPRKALTAHMGKGKTPVRITALAYWFEYGTKEDLGAVKPYENDGDSVPKCEKDGGCEWKCVVNEGGKPTEKEIKTVGDYVRFCLVPKMASTDKKKAEETAPKKEEKKPEPKN